MKLSTISAVLLSGLVTACAHTNSPVQDQTELFDFEAACLDTVHGYALGVDNLDAGRVAALFTEDGYLDVSSGQFSGPAAIKAWLEGVAELDLNMFHHITTHQITQTSPTEGFGRVYVLVNLHMAAAAGASEEDVLTLNSAVYADEYVIEDGACRIKNRKIERRLEN